MEIIFTISDWFIVLLFIASISFILILPDLYSVYKDKENWLPINFPPYTNGDDYHYFALLNFIHRRFLNFFFGYSLSYPKLSASSKFQILGFLFNLPAYHLGFLYSDRRYGVLFVRFWNNFCLGISFIFLFLSISKIYKINHSILLMIFASYIAYILFYPGLLRVRSIIMNLTKKDFIFKHENANDLFRAMFSATTAPLFLISSAFLIHAHSINYSEISFQILSLILTVALFFIYLPISIVFGSIVILSCLINQTFILLILTLITLLILIFFYFYKVKNDEVGKELYAHLDGGTIFLFNPRIILRVIVIITPCLLISFYLFNKEYFFLAFLFLLLGSFSFTLFLHKHQLSRFFDRGSCILMQALIFIFLIILIDNLTISFLLGVFLFGFLTYFFYRQAVFLYKNKSTKISDDIKKRVNFLQLISKSNKQSTIIATESHIISGIIDVFGSDEPLLRQYSLQQYGYKKHLDNVCKNFIILDYSLEDIIKIFCSNVKKTDWIFKRVSENPSDLHLDCNYYTVQYIICCREYNNQIILDGMYDKKNGWTNIYKDMIKEKFKIINIANDFLNISKI